MSILRFVFLVSSVLIFSACEKTIVNHGYIVDSEAFKKIVVGRDDAMAVYSSLGAPTMRSSVSSPEDGSYSWYYVSKITEKMSFMDPVVIDQKTMIITFDKTGVVKGVSESIYEKRVSSVTEKTETKGKTSGILGETFAGLGKYMNRYTDDKK